MPAAPGADGCGHSPQRWWTRPHPSWPGQHPGLPWTGSSLPKTEAQGHDSQLWGTCSRTVSFSTFEDLP